MRFVIIGNGAAGITAAAQIAQAAPGSEIDVYSNEKYPYYPRPRLPELLAGTIEVGDLYFHDNAWYEKRGIQVHLNQSVTALHPDRHRMALGDGRHVLYDRLLLAAGAHSFLPPIANAAQLQGVFTMRDIGDVLAIRAYADGKSKAVVIGGGLLGLEAARALLQLGLSVTVVEFFPYLLPRQLDAGGAAVFTDYVNELGLHVITGAVSESIVDSGAGVARGVALKDGRMLDADLVLVSAGVRSNLDLPRAAGIATNRGVVVDEHMQTSAPDVFAAGDAAEFNGIVWGIVPAALAQGRAAGLNMAGEATIYEDITPSNTLKVAGIDLTSVGTVNPEGEGYEQLRWTNRDNGIYKKFVIQNNRLVGAILLGDARSVGAVTRLVNAQADMSMFGTDILADDFDWSLVQA
ncbi:MAG: FAD-dependent oxidoreductase [Chloroflexi bacterium]|nr:FAD-dependent oxidoreductase [Chloroflexota bacterium]MBU1746142.1 FAD-dependent oxidoreductase [Chloroflexota bacterium]